MRPHPVSRDLLHQYVEQQLDAASARAVQGHLADCAECRGQLDAVRLLTARLRGLPRERLGMAFVPQLMTQLAMPEASSPRGPILLALLSAAAGMLLLLYPVNYLLVAVNWAGQTFQGDIDAAGLWLSLPSALGDLQDALLDPTAINNWLASAGTALQFNLLLGLTLVLAAALGYAAVVMRQQAGGRY